jgi:hypothetical protein
MEVSGQLHTRPLYPRERKPSTHWIGGWVGFRAVLDVVVKRIIHSPRRESNPRTPVIQPVAQRYTDRAISHILYLHRTISNTVVLYIFTIRFSKVCGVITVSEDNSF